MAKKLPNNIYSMSVQLSYCYTDLSFALIHILCKAVRPVSCVSCISLLYALIWFVSCPRLVSLLVNYVPAVFDYVGDYPVYLSCCLVYSLLGLGTENRYQHGTGTYGTGMFRIRTRISMPHFGAMPERSVEIFVLFFSETDVRSIITGTTRAK